MKKIYTASEHEFLAREYHKRVDGVGPTLGIIKVQESIFGYYLNSKINSNNSWIPDSRHKSFIWSLNHGSILPLMGSIEAS